MTEHAKLSPSGAKRWMCCPGSLSYVDLLVERGMIRRDRPTSDAALRGTALHDIAEEMLYEREVENPSWTDNAGVEHAFTTEEIEREVKPYVDRILARDILPDIELQVTAAEGCWGTADSVQPDDENEILYVDDLKTGHGKVNADSPQLAIYAVGALNHYELLGIDFKEVHAAIHQDRIGHVETLVYTIDELREFEKRLLSAIEEVHAAAEDPEKHLVASNEGCQWCPVRSICPSFEHHATELANEDFREMDDLRLGEAMERVPALKAWIKGVEDQVKEKIEAGRKVPGFKMVLGRRTRKYLVEQEEVEAYLKNRLRQFKQRAYQEPKLKTPAQLKAAIIKAEKEDAIRGLIDLDEIIGMVGGNPTIAPEDDKRPAIEPGDRAAADFKEFSEKE